MVGEIAKSLGKFGDIARNFLCRPLIYTLLVSELKRHFS
jgi:hypothetical protein